MSTFDWTLLTRKLITKQLYKLHSRITNQSISIKTLHAILAAHIRSYIPVRVYKQLSEDISKNGMSIGGEYDPQRDKINAKSIKIIFVYNQSDHSLILTLYHFKKLCVLFADTVLHEIMHMQQHRKRCFRSICNYKSKSTIKEQRQQQQYLGNADEVDAYSFNIACELLQKFKNNEKLVVEYLEKPYFRYRAYASIWLTYLAAFEYNIDHPVVKCLKKQAINKLSTAKLGKPYKKSVWVSR